MENIFQAVDQTHFLGDIRKTIYQNLGNCIDSVFDIFCRVKADFKIELEDNQKEIVECVYDDNIRLLALLASRSGGKTFAVIIGELLHTLDYNVTTGITAPKSDQASRLIREFTTRIRPLNPSYWDSKLVKKECTGSRLVFRHGPIWEAFSGNEVSREEGRHFSRLLMDEAQDVSDYSVSNILLPMIQSAPKNKVIKLGVPRYQGHFYRSFRDNNYTTLQYDWTKCGNLYRAGVIEVNGVKYPKSIVDIMPLAKKQFYFPDNPELWTEGQLDIEDFESQYEIKWLANLRKVLNEHDQTLLIGNYSFEHPQSELYYFGLDLAGGALIKPGGDWSALTIGRFRDGVKELVAVYAWQGEITEQLSEILGLIHPKYGTYRCAWGLGDYGEMGPAVVDLFVKEGVKMTGVMFGSREPNSGKNMKNAMFDHFLFELRAGRIKLPSMDHINKHKALKELLLQWYDVESKEGLGINRKISSSGNNKDDMVCSHILLCWGMDHQQQVQLGLPKKSKDFSFPSILKGTSAYDI